MKHSRQTLSLTSHRKLLGNIRQLFSTLRSLHRTTRLLLAAILVGAIIFGLHHIRTAHAAGTPNLISINRTGTATGNNFSINPQISADGRYVVFNSFASDLVANDDNFTPDVFVRDRQTNTTILVSINSAGTGVGNNQSDSPQISADGRYVFFESTASNLVANDTNGMVSDIFMRDLQTSTTSLISLNSAGTGSGTAQSFNPVITPNARFVAFFSYSNDLTTINPGFSGNLFLRDRQTNTTSLVSISSDGMTGSNNPVGSVSITDDGRYLTFESNATNLVSGISDINNNLDVFMRDMQAATVSLVSYASTGTSTGNDQSVTSAISADGRYVAFESNASNLVANDDNFNPDVFVRDLQTGTTSLVSINSTGTGAGNSNSASPQISANGRYVFFQGNASNLVANDTNGNTNDIFVRDLQTNMTSLISINSTGTGSGNGQSGDFVITPDGRYVAFTSFATNLTPSGFGNANQVFARDRQANITTLLTFSSTGTGASNGSSIEVGITPDGQHVVFSSSSTNLTTVPDANNNLDVFVEEQNGQFQFNAAIYSVNEDAGMKTITVTRTGGDTGAVTVNYATSDGTAIAGQDYMATSGTLNFAQGETSKTFDVPIASDDFDESGETINLTLSSPTGGAVLGGSRTAVLTITDDDPTPTLSINSVSAPEGKSGTTDATFTVTLSAASGQTVMISYATADGTAINGQDYTFASGVLTFTPGEMTKTVNVPVIGDTLDEPDETFFVNLSTPTNATVANGQGTGTITDDDTPPAISIDSNDMLEGDYGTTTLSLNVHLTTSSGKTVTVDYATATGTATAGSDYVATSGTLTFTPGQISQNVNITVNGDAVYEHDETFFVNLSNVGNATINTAQGTGTIVNDDAAPTLSINNVSVKEGDSGMVAATFTVTLAGSTDLTATVNYATSNNGAIAGIDYQAASGSFTFTPGQTIKTVTVQVLGDVLDESNETFSVNLSNASNAQITNSPGIGTILDDDPTPTLSINDISFTEGNTGTTNAVMTITLSAPSGQDVLVGWTTADGTAIAGTDYLTTGGLAFFDLGETTKTIAIPIIGDTLDEPNQTFFVNLYDPINANINDGQGVCTIVDNDPAPSLLVNDVSVVEGNSGTTNAVFTLILTNVSGQNVSFNYSTANGTATVGQDFVAASGTLTIPAGSTLANITVPVNGDTINETNETFYINLSSPTNATIFDGLGAGTIQDDDFTPADFDGDGKTDLTVWRPSNGTWYIFNSITSISRIQPWGMSGDVLAPGDYDGDAKADLAIWRPSNSTWYIVKSSDGLTIIQTWGLSTDQPVPGDFDGDGKTDIAVFRPSTGIWYVLRSTDSLLMSQQWGMNGDKLVPGDYDGDGKADFAVWRPSEANWYILRSSNSSLLSQQWGVSTDRPVPGDYDGDGKTDISVWRESNGAWYVKKSSDNSMQVQSWGMSGDVPQPGDYDSDGKTDFAIWRPSATHWYVLKSSDGNISDQTWGASGDVPVPSAYIPN